MALLRVGRLSREPLAAAAQFYGEVLGRVIAALDESDDDLVLVFEPADHTHRGWRLAAIQQLARDHAPRRANALASNDEIAIARAATYLATAPGVTGQYLPLDDCGAIALLSPIG